MLEYNRQAGGFKHDEKNPIQADVVILDEMSMVDTVLMYHLLKAIPTEATLILVGDSNQLPSVGPGNVLRDMIHSNVLSVMELNEIFRQAKKSLIVVNAHRINQGLMPFDPGRDMADYFFIEQEVPEQALQIVLELVQRRIPRRFGLEPMKDIQVLCPMHKGTVGTENLNRELQKSLNPSKNEIIKGDRHFRINDKVMQIRNNYEKEVFNGDIGLIAKIDEEDRELVVFFDDRSVNYDFTELDEIEHAYAITVHKSQGSEYPAVVLPLLPQHHLLLKRNLVYTAVTRGKKLVVVVGSKKALATGVKNDSMAKRYTFLSERLKVLS
jgi:exodeoxyribonuclease V alpha subunit